MKVFETCNLYRNELYNLKHPIALIPTMGALHEGHLKLVREAKKVAKTVVVSIFVNPIQFNNAIDLEKYPRTLDADFNLLFKENCDILFHPTVDEMYPTMTEVKLDFAIQNNQMEGKFRSGHFNGVAIVVSKLFHIIQPDFAFFGQKIYNNALLFSNLYMICLFK